MWRGLLRAKAVWGVLRSIATFLKWGYFVVSEIIGWAGVPDDINAWGRTMTPLLELLDIWGVRAFLVLSGIAVVTYSQWKPRVASILRRRRTSGERPNEDEHTDEDYWREAEQRFDRINGEVQAIWQLYNDGHVEWTVYARDDRDRRRFERFLSEARRLGRVVSRLPLARKFPSASFTDDADHWINIVGAIVDPSSTTGDGRNQRGTYESGGIDDLVDASKVACGRLASLSQENDR